MKYIYNYTVLLIIAMVLIASCGPRSNKNPPLSREGEIDFEGWDFEKAGPVEIRGDWELYPGVNLVENPSDPRKEMNTGCTLTVASSASPPDDLCCQYRITEQSLRILSQTEKALFIQPEKRWDSVKNYQGNPLTEQGAVLYRLKLKGIKRTLTLYSLGHQYTSSRLWKLENGLLQLGDQAGHPAANRESTRPMRRGLQISVGPQTTEILMEVSNFHHSRSNFGVFTLGLNDSFVEDQLKNTLSDAFTIGFLCMAGLYHFFVFGLRRQLRSALFLGFFCLLIAVRVFVMADFFQHLYPGIDYYSILQRLEYISIPLGWCAIGLYIFFLFEKKAWPAWFFTNLITGIVFSLIIMFTDTVFFTTHLSIIQLGLIYFIVWLVAVLVRHCMGRGEESAALRHRAWSVFLFSTIFLAAVIHDILVAQRFIFGPFVAQYGLVFFLLGQSYILARDNSFTWQRSETLFIDLQRKVDENSELRKTQVELQTETDFMSRDIEQMTVEFASMHLKIDSLKKERDSINTELVTATRQLIQAEKMSSIGALVSGIAHDIGNPVNYIMGSHNIIQKNLKDLDGFLTSLLESDPDSAEIAADFRLRFDKIYAALDSVDLGARRIAEINQSMRNISRHDTEVTDGVDVISLVEESAAILGSKLKDFTVEKKFGDDLSEITCHRSHIGQVIMNLISNAADALQEKQKADQSETGKIEIRVRTREDQGEKKVEIAVEDSGPGVPEELRQKIFDPFFTTKPPGTGTGLGLAICSKILTEHDGTITLGPARNLGGAEFVVMLPVLRRHSQSKKIS